MANTKISALTADATPTADDLVVTVNDPGGTPATRKATITNFTKAIPVVIGDSGSGGTKGLVPAPAAGDAAANKFLKADGTFAVPSGTGTPGGADTQVQFNDGGAFGGDADFVWNKTSNTLTLGSTPSIAVGTRVLIGGTASGVGVTMSRDDQIKWTDNTTVPTTVDVKVRRINSGYGLVLQNATDAEKTTPTNQRWLYTQGGHRVTADFAKAANTTLATITGCTVPLFAGSNETLNYWTFIFEAEVDCDATGGYKFAVAYSGTLDEGITYYVEVIDEADGSRDAFSRQTTSGGAVGGAGPTAIHVRIVGNISAGGNGNLTIQFAQNVASGTSTVKELGSLLTVTPILD